jgi:hypothetical protein
MQKTYRLMNDPKEGEDSEVVTETSEETTSGEESQE